MYPREGTCGRSQEAAPGRGEGGAGCVEASDARPGGTSEGRRGRALPAARVHPSPASWHSCWPVLPVRGAETPPRSAGPGSRLCARRLLQAVGSMGYMGVRPPGGPPHSCSAPRGIVQSGRGRPGPSPWASPFLSVPQRPRHLTWALLPAEPVFLWPSVLWPMHGSSLSG